MDRRAIAERERKRRTRGSRRPGEATRDVRLASLERRVASLESRASSFAAQLYPEPDFDDGWIELESGGRIEWSPDEKRPVKRVDVLRKTGPESFAPLGKHRHEGEGVWYRDHEVNGVPLYVIYNVTSDPVTVRVQGWYGEAR